MARLKLICSPGAAIISLLLTGLILAGLCAIPYGVIYVVWVIQLVLPLALCVTALTAGLLPAALCAVMGDLALWQAAGSMGAALGACYIVPIIGAFVFCMARELPFWKSVWSMTGATFAGQLIVFLLLTSWTGGNLYQAGAQALAEGIEALPGSDGALYALLRAGILSVPSEYADSLFETVDGVTRFTGEVRAEFFASIKSMAADLLKAYVPASLVSHSILNGALCVALPLYYGKRAAERRAYKTNSDLVPVPDLRMPELCSWHLSREDGYKVYILAVGYVLEMLPGSEAVRTAGQMLVSAFTAVFILQGLASISFIQKKRGTRPVTRKVVLTLLYLFLQQALVIMGVLDQLMDFRALRPKKARDDGREP